jgi:hypothetical protein
LVLVRERGYPIPKLPIRLRATPDLEIPIGPIIIVIEPGRVTVCIDYTDDDGFSCIH